MTATASAEAYYSPIAERPDMVPVTVQRMIPASPRFEGVVTHYGVSYNGYKMGCGPQLYDSEDPSIIAVGPAHAAEWPCGTTIEVCGAAGCIVGVRQDGCPGCGPYHLDLSEAGIGTVCGDQAGVCRVRIQKVAIVEDVHIIPKPWLGY